MMCENQTTVQGLLRQILRNLILKGLFVSRLMLRFPPILAGKRNWMRGFYQPYTIGFLRFCLLPFSKHEIWDLRTTYLGSLVVLYLMMLGMQLHVWWKKEWVDVSR